MWVRRSVALQIDASSDGSWRFYDIEFDVPPNSEISGVFYDGYVGALSVQARSLTIVGYGEIPIPSGDGHDPLDLGSFLIGGTGHQVITFRLIHVDIAEVLLKICFQPTAQAQAQWQIDVWNALYNAAQTQYYAQQQDIAAKIAQLEDRLTNVDTLTLRREESEEIMKMAVASLVGNYAGQFWGKEEDFALQANQTEAGSGWPPIQDPMIPFGAALTLDPRPIGSAFSRISSNEVYSLLPSIQNNEEVVRFINQAIEWENVVTFLYSYFWDTPESWEFISNLQHADSTRQAFLRAGSARVVLTIRKGWETMWTVFVNTGQVYVSDDKDSNGGSKPYLRIAQEIAAYDDRNYPGIPPANPNQSAVRLEEAVYTSSTTALDPSQPSSQNPPSWTITVDSTDGFLVGAQVVIDSGVGDSFPSGALGKQESTTITAINKDNKQLSLENVQNPHGGNGEVYAVVQPGEKGVLIAEWNEYTPTSGTDIQVTSNLETIA